MGNSRDGSVRSVQIERDRGAIEEATTQQTVHKAIWDEIHRKRFYLAEQAPIYQGSLRGDFGYTSCSPTAKKYSREGMSIQKGLIWQHANS